MLKPSTTYTINVTVGTGNKENLNVYIDYNNNGVFTDAGEELFTVTGVQGLQTKTFTTPASPTLGKYLRMRVIDDYGTSISPCTAPSYGQVEDYAIEFAATPVAAFKVNDTTICTGANVQFTDQSSNLPTTWAWSFKGGTPDTSNSENPLITYNTPGTYAVTLVASNTAGSGSITKYTYITVHSNPSVATTLAGDSATAEVTNGTPSYTYSWSNGSQTYKDINLATGTYTVTVKDANGCQNATSVAVISTGISNVDPSLSFSVYPNPVTDNATIILTTPSTGPLNIELFDITGQKVQTICSSKVVSANATFQLNGSGLERGIYFLRLSSSQATKLVKVVIGN